MAAEKSEAVIGGAIIFIDLDGYLSRVRALTPLEEWEFAKPLHEVVETLAPQFGFNLARTFGDGYLLYAQHDINDELLRNSDPSIFKQTSAFFSACCSRADSQRGKSLFIDIENRSCRRCCAQRHKKNS